MVAIARALQDQEGQHTGVLVLDEPTASLPRAEVVRLMGALNRFAAAGQTILFVSHRLDEVIDTAAQATVLRDGRLAGTLVDNEITEGRLIELIAGRALDRMYPVMPPVESDEIVLEAKGLNHAGRSLAAGDSDEYFATLLAVERQILMFGLNN